LHTSRFARNSGTNQRGGGPGYPLKEAELPKFRLWIRKIHMIEDNEIVMLSYEDEIIDGNTREAEIVDGRNVRESYTLVSHIRIPAN